jgi:hypothetical protein
VIRRRFLTEPDYFIGGRGRSRLQDFERHGTRGAEIFRHGHFLKHLHYIVHGPNLPKSAIKAFQQKVIDCGEPFTSGDAITISHFARHLVRSQGLNPGTAAEEFYKLALECGLDAGDARSVRDAVKRAL